MSEKLVQWTQAIKCLTEDSTACVTCPMCRMSLLDVSDVTSAIDPSRFERIIRCPVCEELAVVLMTTHV